MYNFHLKDHLQGDRQIWLITILLSCFSLAAVYSSVSALAYRTTNGIPELIMLKHAGFLLGGLFIIYFIHRFDFLEIAPIAKIFLWVTPFLLIYTLVLGREVGGAKRWINILGISFQTSDLVRIVLITNLTAMLARKQNTKITWKDFRSIIIWCGALCGLLALSSFSTSVILAVTCFGIMFIGRVPGKFLAGLVASVVIGLFLALSAGYLVNKITGKEYGRTQTVIDRLEAHFDRDFDGNHKIGGDVGSESSQLDEALLAIARGGVFGQGPGNSAVKHRLAEAYSDFIFAIILEEYGLLGGIGLMALYLWLLQRGIWLVQNSTRPFAGLLSIGLTLTIVFQAFAHMFINVGLGPVTGQTLPLISKGGTSILFTAIALGIVLSVSKTENNTKEPAAL